MAVCACGLVLGVSGGSVAVEKLGVGLGVLPTALLRLGVAQTFLLCSPLAAEW